VADAGTAARKRFLDAGMWEESRVRLSVLRVELGREESARSG
jgi:hypothetical protein